MRVKLAYTVAAFLIHSFTALFCDASESDIVPDMPNFVHEILNYSPEVVDRAGHRKLYLDKQRVFISHSKMCLLAGDFVSWQLPTEAIAIDDEGIYIPIFSETLEKRIFIQKCNNCLYEWEAKWYEGRCPRCRSADISNILNRTF